MSVTASFLDHAAAGADAWKSVSGIKITEHKNMREMKDGRRESLAGCDVEDGKRMRWIREGRRRRRKSPALTIKGNDKI